MKKYFKIFTISTLSILLINGCDNTNTSSSKSSFYNSNNISSISTSNSINDNTISNNINVSSNYATNSNSVTTSSISNNDSSTSKVTSSNSVTSSSISSSTKSSSSTTSSLNSSSSSKEEKIVSSISLNYDSEIIYEYLLGEQLKIDNTTINVVYLNGEEETIPVTIDMIKLFDTSINQETDMNTAGYKMVIISYGGYETSFLIEVIDNNAPFDKMDPLIVFDFDAGTTFKIGSDITPGVSIIPNNLNYKVSYSSETTGYNSEMYPTEAGTYALVVEVEGNDKYNSITTWRWFILAGEKEIPVITFNYTAGATFTIGSNERPTVTVSEGADYVITYSSDTTGYNSEEYPTEPGTYSLVVTVNENDKYGAAKQWLWFRLISNEKEVPTVTFNYTAGATFTIGSNERPTVTVSEGADYVITYSSDTTGYNSEEYPTEPGTYSLVVTVNENDKYASLVIWRWFRLVE